eukprot:TRINITY_DN35469_c0_g1_i1.p1 TRINITY_DN35469_c0_g1~~TRINITY_DN35469_c0_g1_i1.p1  ORF type:complete len:661 (+),score=218.46 TRINITY_DN35469_c0_g1_i1:51-1985(+)
MASVPTGFSRGGVWGALGLPDFGASAAVPPASDELMDRLRASSRRRELGRRPAESDEESDPGGAALRDAWLGDGGLTQALRTAAAARGERPLTPTSRPFGPLCISPRRGFLAQEEDAVARGVRRAPQSAKLAGTMRSDVNAWSMIGNASAVGSPAPPHRKEQSQSAELVDAVRRLLFQLRRLGEERPTHELIAGFVGSAPTGPNDGGEVWRSATAAMRAPLGEIVEKTESVLDPLYRSSALKGSAFGLRADDASYPLSILLQLLGSLRDKVAAAIASVVNFFGSVDVSKYVGDCGQLRHYLEHVFAQVTKLSASGASEPPLRRDAAIALMAEFVPCPSSRRFWIGHFGVDAPDVEAAVFREAVTRYASDALPTAAATLAAGLTETLDPLRRGRVALCEFAVLFGELPIFDTVDVLLRRPDTGYDALVSEAPFAWDPPRRRAVVQKRGARAGEAARKAVDALVRQGWRAGDQPRQPENADDASVHAENPQVDLLKEEVETLRKQLSEQRAQMQEQWRQRDEERHWSAAELQVSPRASARDVSATELVAAAITSDAGRGPSASPVAVSPPAEPIAPEAADGAAAWAKVDLGALLRQADPDARKDRGFARWLRKNCDGDAFQQLVRPAERASDRRHSGQRKPRTRRP